MIGISSYLNFIPSLVNKDKEGRYILVQGCLEGQQFVLVNLYAPNTEQKEVFCNVIKHLEQFADVEQWILAGDLNGVMKLADKELVKSQEQSPHFSKNG